MKWVRSLGSVGVGVVVAWFLVGHGVGALSSAYECYYPETAHGMCSQPPVSGPIALARLAIAPFNDGLFLGDTWLILALMFALIATVAVGGLVTALLAPAWRVAHAMLVGPLLMHFLAVPRPLVWSLPAMAGGVIGWMIADIWALRRRSDDHAPVDGSAEPVG